MRPKILLSAKLRMENYIAAVNAAGGTSVAEYLSKGRAEDFDGLILCGGSDIDPALYGEALNGAVDIDYERDKAELSLIKDFIKSGKPIMGICRGCQLLNVYFGGTLYQNIENSAQHRSGDTTDLIHRVKAEKGCIAATLYGGEFTVNSFHHQAIKSLGVGLRVTMTSGEVVEGFEHCTMPIFGVQWHPERMCAANRRDDTVDGIEIFKYFIDLCRQNPAFYYNALSALGDDPVYDPPNLREYMDKWDGQRFIDELKLSCEKSVLEIGVGTGRLAVRTAPLCGKFCGIDVSSSALERAGKNLAGNRNVRLICGDFLNTQLAEKFDVIYSSLTFMHIAEKSAAIAKAAGLMNRGGRFILSIDKNQSEYIENGALKIKIFPDNPDLTEKYIKSAGLSLSHRFETEFAVIFVCVKN